MADSSAYGGVQVQGLTLEKLARLTSTAYNVKTYGAKGDGTTDDATAIQAAVDAAGVAGGVVYFPTPGQYAIASTITIQSLYPVFLVSHMLLVDQTDGAGSYITPSAALANGMFHYLTPSGQDRWKAGGGGIIGLTFYDAVNRDKSILAALNLEDFGISFIRDCCFLHLLGSAILTDRAIQSSATNCNIRNCGDTSKPAIQLGVGAESTHVTQSFGVFNSRLEVNHLAPYIEILTGNNNNKIIGCGFESDETASTEQDYIKVNDTATGTIICGCHFNRNSETHVRLASVKGGVFTACTHGGDGGSNPRIVISGQRWVISDIHTNDAVSQTGTQILVSGNVNSLANIYMARGGNLDVTGTLNGLSGIYCSQLTTTETHAIKLAGNNNSLTGAYIYTTGAGVLGVELVGSSSAANVILQNLEGGGATTFYDRVPEAVTTLTYSTIVGTDASLGKLFELSVTDGNAFTISNPVRTATGRTISYSITNDSGGSMGAITWGPAFVLAESFRSPNNGNTRTIAFYYDGTSWIESHRSGSGAAGLGLSYAAGADAANASDSATSVKI